MSLESVYRKGPKRMRSVAPARASLSLSLSLFVFFWVPGANDWKTWPFNEKKREREFFFFLRFVSSLLSRIFESFVIKRGSREVGWTRVKRKRFWKMPWAASELGKKWRIKHETNQKNKSLLGWVRTAALTRARDAVGERKAGRVNEMQTSTQITWVFLDVSLVASFSLSISLRRSITAFSISFYDDGV
jgi:hypothetical protein